METPHAPRSPVPGRDACSPFVRLLFHSLKNIFWGLLLSACYECGPQIIQASRGKRYEFETVLKLTPGDSRVPQPSPRPGPGTKCRGSRPPRSPTGSSLPNHRPCRGAMSALSRHLCSAHSSPTLKQARRFVWEDVSSEPITHVR